MEFRLEEIPGKEVSITEKDESVLTYCYGESVLHSHIHPLYAPNGQVVTEGSGEKHLPGLCFSFGTVKDDKRQSIVRHRSASTLDWETSEKFVKFISQTTWQVSNHVLIETCKTVVHPRQSDVQILDFIVDLHAPTHPISIEEDIGLGYYAVEMEHRKAADSDGRIGESEVNGQESEWVTLYGITGNTVVGLAIFPHPENGKTTLLVEDAYLGYLFAQTQPFTLDVNAMRTLKYRVIIYVGDLFTIEISEYYHKYTRSDVNIT